MPVRTTAGAAGSDRIHRDPDPRGPGSIPRHRPTARSRRRRIAPAARRRPGRVRRPERLVVADPDNCRRRRAAVTLACRADGSPPHASRPGQQAVVDLAGSLGGQDVVLNAITGSVGLLPTLSALASGAPPGPRQQGIPRRRRPGLVTDAAAPGQILPVDSEHTAIAQALAGVRPDQVDHLVVTASGGPLPRTEPRRSRVRHAGASSRAPHLGDGPRDHHQLGDPGQQGPRGRRGLLPVRSARGPRRRGRPPAVHRPFHGDPAWTAPPSRRRARRTCVTPSAGRSRIRRS